MKRLLLSLALVAVAASAGAQRLGVTPAVYMKSTGAPSATCSATVNNGVFDVSQALNWYQCSNNNVGGTYVWNALGGSAGGATSNQNVRSIGAVFDGGGVALTGTVVRCTPVNYSGTITGVTLSSDVSGSATVDVRTVAYSSYAGPSSASTITASATPALSSAAKYQDATLTGWTTTLAANTMVCFNLSSPSTVTWLAINVKVQAN
jgi:hypothetical protein